MLSILRLAAVFAFVATFAGAGTDFGTKQEAEVLAKQLIEVIDNEGIEAAVATMHDPKHPFFHSRMGVNLFQNGMVIGDNREPEMVAADFTEISDLTGEPVWPRIQQAADASDDVVLKWYHYDTQDVYDYHCYSLRASRDDGLVMICR